MEVDWEDVEDAEGFDKELLRDADVVHLRKLRLAGVLSKTMCFPQGVVSRLASSFCFEPHR